MMTVLPQDRWKCQSWQKFVRGRLKITNEAVRKVLENSIAYKGTIEEALDAKSTKNSGDNNG